MTMPSAGLGDDIGLVQLTAGDAERESREDSVAFVERLIRQAAARWAANPCREAANGRLPPVPTSPV